MGSKTSIDVVNILFWNINNSLLFSDAKKPNGGLYKFQRPINSVKEDVVINSLPINREAVQEGILNVNIYVPNLTLTSGGITDKSQPNTARLAELSALFNSIFDGENWANTGEYEFNIQQDNTFEDVNNQHYINFRIEFYSVNI